MRLILKCGKMRSNVIARLKQANLAAKGDIADFVKKISMIN